MARLADVIPRLVRAVVAFVVVGQGVMAGLPALGADVGLFELRVMGLDGKGVGNAAVEFRSDQQIQAGWVRKGTLVKQARYRSSLRTDGDGWLSVAFPRALSDLNIYITTPGFGPYWAGWSSQNHVEVIPSRFTAELEAGWSVGGVVVDEKGKPVEGVRVHPNIEFKKRPGVTLQLATGETAKTDAHGKWRFDSVPISMRELFVEADHRAFRPVRRSLVRGEFGIELGQEPVRKIVLDRGATVTGKVSDEARKPIEGALVRAQFLNEVREARTGADGVYRLEGCDLVSTRIVASAKGKTLEVRDARVEPELGTVDFVLKPGGIVKIRVVDIEGKPVPKARIFFQEWRGRRTYFEFGHVNQYANKDGIWEWNEAPLDEFTADISGGENRLELVSQRLVARAEEYLFRLPSPLVVSGRVIDAETKEPIQRFKVQWNERERFDATDGRFELRERRGESGYQVRVEADGYRSAVSRGIAGNEGKVTVDFALERGNGIVGKVVTPRNLPAAGAKVVLAIAGRQIGFKNGDIEDGTTFANRETTDNTGRFAFSGQDKPFQLVITHELGYAMIESKEDWNLMRIIHLEPWAKVEGTFQVGKQAVAGVPIEIHYFGPNAQAQVGVNYYPQANTTTGPGGRFVFDRVIPAKGMIGRSILITQDDGAIYATSARYDPVEFAAGKTIVVKLGGTGKPVVGRLEAPDELAGKVRWNFVKISVFPEVEDHRSRANFTVTLEKTGRFKIDDVPAGEYGMVVDFVKPQGLIRRSFRLNVPAMAEGRSDEPLDVGAFRLEAIPGDFGIGR